MSALFCPACQRPVAPGDAICFHCRAVLDPFTRGARIAERYVIEENIGQGGMGRVYRAYDEVLHEKVAIKTLLPEFSTDPGFLTRFRDEVRLARRVAHPNVCRVHDYVDHEGTPFLSMEWVDGETLAARLKRLGPRPEDELQVVLRDVTEALRALWSNGIVHRDLKPANLMWTRADRVKVMDFGLARAMVGKGETDRTSGVIGSPEYLSPEQIRGESATERSDTYALGVTLFELATGHPPFRGDSPAQTLMKHLSEEPDALALSNISAALRSTILNSLDKRAEARPDFREPANDRPWIEADPRDPTSGSPSRTIAWALPAAGLAILIVILAYFGFGEAAAPGASPLVSTTASPLGSPSSPGMPADRTGSETAPVVTPQSPPAVGASPRGMPKAPPPSATAIPSVESTPGSTPVLLEAPPPEPRSATTPTPAPAALEATPAGTAVPASEARLIVVAIPWAEVFVDGDRKGLTPLPALVLPPGSHMVELRHPDFRPFRRTIELKAGEQSRLSVNLRLEAIRR